MIAAQGWASDCGDADATTWCVETTDTTVDGDTFCGDPSGTCDSSDTITIEGGARGSILFRDFDGSGSYITIQNEDTNRVVITHNGTPGWGVLSFYNCKYIDFRGDNNSSYTYGILVNNDGDPSTPAGTVWVYGESDHIKIGYIEVDFPTGASGYISNGISVQDVTLTNAWTFDTFEIHNNYIHDTRYAGMYLGHNQPHYTGSGQQCADGCPYTANFSIHDNLLKDLGSYGLNLKGTKGSNSTIYNNIIRPNTDATSTGNNCGGGNCDTYGDDFTQGIKVSYTYENYYVTVYDNRIEKTMGPGLLFWEAEHLVYDNIILGCGVGNEIDNGHGIRINPSYSMPDTNNDRVVQLYDNIIVEPTRYGVFSLVGYDGYANLERNIIAEPGTGEYSGTYLTEGTGSDANVYNADADNICFTTWSDDSDYSNDDFTLCCEYPYSGGCTFGNVKGAQIQGGCINCN
jgi:hypothetical protein